MYFDNSGLIVQKDGDGGDTLQRESMYWFLYWFNFVRMSNYVIPGNPQRSMPETYFEKLEVAPGIYVRNPEQWNDPKDVSRDQLKPLIWYCAAYGEKKRLSRLFKSVVKRFFFAQNHDTMIGCLGSFIRAAGSWTTFLYPLLFLFDLVDTVGILIRLLDRNPDHVDDNNGDLDILGALAFKPTVISYLNAFLWGQFRPKNFGNDLVDNNCLAAIAWYHRPNTGGNKEFVDLFEKPITKYLKKHF